MLMYESLRVPRKPKETVKSTQLNYIILYVKENSFLKPILKQIYFPQKLKTQQLQVI